MTKEQNELRYAIYSAVLVALVLSMAVPLGVVLVQAKANSGATATIMPDLLGAGNSTLITTSANAFTGASVAVYLSTNGYASITGDTLIASNVPLTNGALKHMNVTIPADTAPGNYYIKLTDDNGATVVVASPGLTVLAPPYAPACQAYDYNTFQATGALVTSGYPGDEIQVCATGLNPSTEAHIDFIGANGAILASTTTTTNPEGALSFHSTLFEVPHAGAGSYIVEVFTNTSDSPSNNGATSPFTILPALYPDLAQYAPGFTGSGFPNHYNAYSIRANQAGEVLKFYGYGLPDGTVASHDVAIFNSQGVQVATGITQLTNVVNGEFNGQYTVHPNFTSSKIAVNVTILSGLSPGTGYYAQFDISGVLVDSFPFIASVPTNGNFQASFSPTQASGLTQVVVQGTGFGNDTLVTGAVQVPYASILNQIFGESTADENGGLVFYLYPIGGVEGIPNGTYSVILQDYLGASAGTVQKTIGQIQFVPSFSVTDISYTDSFYGVVGDTLEINANAPIFTGGSFPSAFQATSITLTSAANGYTQTITNTAPTNTRPNGEPIAEGYYGSNIFGNFPYNVTPNNLYNGKPLNLNISLPNMPAGLTYVTINGAIAGGRQVSIPGGTFYVLTSISAIYLANFTYSSNDDVSGWQALKSGQGVFAGDILDVQLSGFPVNATASINFTASNLLLSEGGVTISGSTPSADGTVELILNVPFLPASSISHFGPYELYINNAFGVSSVYCEQFVQFGFGQVVDSGLNVIVNQPGQFKQAAPHVYVDPQYVMPESVWAQSGYPAIFPTNFNVGMPVTVLGTGFGGGINEFVMLNQSYDYYVDGPVTDVNYSQISIMNITTNSFGVFNFTVNLPNLPSAVLDSSGHYEYADYAVSVYQTNPSALVNNIYTAIPTHNKVNEFVINPAISITPDSGTVNSSVIVSGTGFGMYDTVSLYVQSYTVISVGTAYADATGTFSVNLTIPAVPTGPVNITASGVAYTGDMAFHEFQVTAAPKFSVSVSAASPLNPGATQVVTLSTTLNGAPGSATAEGGYVLQSNGVVAPLSFLTTATGEYQAIYHVPTGSTALGTYVITTWATYGSQNLTATTSFSVVAAPINTTPTVIVPTNSTFTSQVLSEISGLQSGITTLTNDLSQLAASTASAIQALDSSLGSLASSISQIHSQFGSIEIYSLGALLIAFIALIVIIYGVFVRRRM